MECSKSGTFRDVLIWSCYHFVAPFAKLMDDGFYKCPLAHKNHFPNLFVVLLLLLIVVVIVVVRFLLFLRVYFLLLEIFLCLCCILIFITSSVSYFVCSSGFCVHLFTCCFLYLYAFFYTVLWKLFPFSLFSADFINICCWVC